MSAYRIIETSELQRRQEEGRVPHFWNVLTDEWFTGELIPGSRRVPLDEIGREVRELDLPEDAEIVVYCSGDGCPQSAAAADKLAGLGYRNVSAFEGGLAAWKEAGLEVETAGVEATTE